MSYKAYLMGAVSRIQRDFGDYVPSQFPANLLAKLDDETAYQFVNAWRDMTANNYQAKENYRSAPAGENEFLHLTVEKSGDSVRVVNTRTGGVEALFSMEPDGLFSFHGPRKYAFLLGGRSELGGVLEAVMKNYKSLSDGDLLRDHQKLGK